MSLTQLDFLPFIIFKNYFVSLIPAGPDYEVCILDVLRLLVWSLSFDELDSLFISFLDALVKPLGVASEPSVRVHKSILAREDVVAELSVPVSFRLVDCAVEDTNPISVQDLNAARCEVLGVKRIEVEVPLFVLKVSVAETSTFTIGLSRLRRTPTAGCAALVLFH